MEKRQVREPSMRRLICGGVILSLSSIAVALRPAEFDRLDGLQIAALLRDPRTKTHQSLGFRDLEKLPSVLRDARGALLLVRTDQGNLARLLVAPAFRKRPPAEVDRERARPELIPILLVERFEVFGGEHPATRIARGQDLMFFPGFQLDLDSGRH